MHPVPQFRGRGGNVPGMSARFALVLAIALCLAECTRPPSPPGAVMANNPDLLPFDPYLWQATRDTVDMLPIESNDPVAGTLQTGWGTPRGDYREQFRVSVHLDYNATYRQAVAVTVERQEVADLRETAAQTDPIAAAHLAAAIADEAGELRLAANMVKQGS